MRARYFQNYITNDIYYFDRGARSGLFIYYRLHVKSAIARDYFIFTPVLQYYHIAC